MKFFLLSLALAAPGWAVTAYPSSIKVYMRQALAYPDNQSAPPISVPITVTGAGDWAIKRSGPLSTACNAAWGYCLNTVDAATAASTDCSMRGGVVTGNGPGTVYLCGRSLVTHELPLGVTAGSFTIGSTTVNVELIVVARNAWEPWLYKPGYPRGCAQNAPYNTEETCVITGEQPASTTFATPLPGGSYIDPQFGYPVTRLTASGDNIQYGALSAFSANAKYILTGTGPAGNIRVLKRDTGEVAYDGLPGINLNYSAWDPSDDEKLWYMEGQSIKYRILSTGTVTTAATYGFNISMGGTADITDDGWWALRDAGGFTVCAVKLIGLTPNTQSQQTFCGSVAGYTDDIDFVQVTQVDSESGKRYLLVVGQLAGRGGSQVYSVGTSSLNYEYPLDVPGSPHSDVGQDREGRQIFFANYAQIYGATKNYLAAIQLNKGLKMAYPVEVGGGLRFLANTDSAPNTDGHFGGTWRGVFVYSPVGNSNGIPVKPIQTITSTYPCVANSSGHGYSTGNSIRIGGGPGVLNGVFTVTVLSADAYSMAGADCRGVQYTADSASSVLSELTAQASPFRQEIIVWDGFGVHRLATHRSKLYDRPGMLSYFSFPRASISRDGRYVAYASNFGIPEQPSVYTVDLGRTATQVMSVDVSSSDKSAKLSYSIPAAQGAATIIISASPALTSPLVSVSDGLTSLTRQYTANGLDPDTQYYLRVTTSEFAYTGPFRTLESSVGTAPAITIHPQNKTVSTGQTATFTVAASGSSPLNYQWQRNGVNIPGAPNSPSYTTPATTSADNGTQYRCVVSNTFGNATSNPATLTLTVVSNQLPTASINLPAAGTLYTFNQTISFSGSASDPEDGNLPSTAFNWKIDFHHDTHFHPHVSSIIGQSGTFQTNFAETSTNVFYRITLTVTDSANAQTVVVRDIFPRISTIRLESNPVGLQLTLDGTPVTSGFTFSAVAGQSRVIEAVSPQGGGGRKYTFASWSDGGAQQHTIAVPTTAVTLTAKFQKH
jgi:hypothetical protein